VVGILGATRSYSKERLAQCYYHNERMLSNFPLVIINRPIDLLLQISRWKPQS
jgi:hypothetical protein